MKDELKKSFLTRIQKSFPIQRRPFLQLAKELGSSEEELIALYDDLCKRGIIRQTSAIFDTKSLGYRSSLVAFKVADIDKAAKIINAHPGVSHNYERDHDFNLWFTVATAPNSKLGLERTVEILARECDAKEYLILPTKRMFKISVQLDVKGDRAKKEQQKKRKKIPLQMEPLHYDLVRTLQKNIQATKEPFGWIIKQLQIDYATLQQESQRLMDAGIMRRFATILYHRKAGFSANAMVVWRVEEEIAESIGEVLAAYSAVSHCYLRPTFSSWPYPLFTMVHGRSKEEVEGVVEEMAREVGIDEYRYLYSTREFKKVRIEYFSEAFEAWESNY